MRTTPAHRTPSGSFYAKITSRGEDYSVRVILYNALHSNRWGLPCTHSPSTMEREYQYIPSDMRLPVNNIWTDES